MAIIYDKKTFYKIYKAVLVTALVPSVLVGLYFAFGRMETTSIAERFQALFFISFIAFFIALFHSVVFGIPAYLFFRKRDMLRWWTCLFIGLIVSTVPYGVFSLVIEPSTLGNVTQDIALLSVLGAMGGLSGWYVVRDGLEKPAA